MSYSIVHVIYGVPLNESVSNIMDEWEEANDQRWNDYDGWTKMYTASGYCPAGFCGVQLDMLDSYVPQLVSSIKSVPTPAQKEEAETLVAALDPSLRAVAGPIGVYFIWSDS